jgi:hypothetical protein
MSEAFRARELIGADHDRVIDREGLALSVAGGLIIGFPLDDDSGNQEFLGEFLEPLLSQIRRRDDEHAALAFRPSLRNHEAGLDRLAESDLIGEERAFRKRRGESEERRIDLMRIEVDLGAGDGSGQTLGTVRRAALGELMRDIFRVIIRYHHNPGRRMRR